MKASRENDFEQQRWQFSKGRSDRVVELKTGLLRPKREKAHSMEGKRTATTVGKVSLDRRRENDFNLRSKFPLIIFETNLIDERRKLLKMENPH